VDFAQPEAFRGHLAGNDHLRRRQMETRFLLRSVPPFRLDLTAWALQRRPGNLIDRWESQAYRRVLALESGTFEIAVSEVGEGCAT
jgi:hypothetical protein